MRSLLLIALFVASAHANGRAPNTQSITFRDGNANHIVAGMTFGELVSMDGGDTWFWMCEAAIGYGGVFDPDYAYSSSGAIYATTPSGLRVNRTGCVYEATALGTVAPARVETNGTATVHVAASDPSNASIVTSADDGQTFPTIAMPGLAGDWWQAIRVAPSDPQRVYLSGYRIDSGTRIPLLFTSDDGGASFTAMTTSNLLVSQSSVVEIVGVAPSTPTTVYALVTFENDTMTDGVYVSTNAGGTWTRMTGGTNPLVFLARSSGELVVGSPALAQVSDDGGMTWQALVAPPPIGCLAERSNGEVWACSPNFVPGAPRIVKTSDLVTWIGVLRYAEIDGPVACAAGTVQHDTCGPQWCVLRRQFGATADPTGCEPAPDGLLDGVVDAAVPLDASTTMTPRKDGCCNAGGPSSGVLALLVFASLGRRGSRRRDQPQRPHCDRR